MGGFKSNNLLRAYKITNILFLVLLIPVILISAFSIFSIYSTRVNGGIPNIFGYYSIQAEKEFSFNTIDGKITFNNGKNYLFKSQSKDFKKGDIIAYYSEKPKDFSSALASDLEKISLTVKSRNALIEESPKSQINIVKIGEQKATVTISDEEYTCYTYYTSEGEYVYDINNLIFEIDIFAIATNQSGFFADAIAFCSSVNAFIFLIIIPALVLLILKVLSVSFYNRYQKMGPAQRKAKIVSDGASQTYNIGSKPQRTTSSRPSTTAKPQPTRRPPSRPQTTRKSTKPK